MSALDAIVEPNVERLRRAVMSGPVDDVIDLRLPAEHSVGVDDDFAVRRAPGRPRSESLLLRPTWTRSNLALQIPLAALQRDALTLATFAGLLALAVMNALDVVTTRWALSIAHSHGLQAVEANPLARLLLTGWWAELVKTVAIVGLAARAVTRPVRLQVVCLLWAVVGVYTMVVVSNALTLRAVQ